MGFKQDGIISTWKGEAMKLVDNFTHHCSNIASTENDSNIGIGKMWTVIDRLSTILKSNLSEKIKREFFSVSIIVWLHHLNSYGLLYMDTTMLVDQQGLISISSMQTLYIVIVTDGEKESKKSVL